MEKVPSLIIQIELTSLVGHYDRQSRVARGVVTVHFILTSASDNRVIVDRSYEETSSSLVGKFDNAYRYMFLHIGKTLNAVVREMIMDLENALLREAGN